MLINAKLFSYNTLGIGIMVSDNEDVPFPKFFKYHRNNAYMQFSPFLTFDFSSDASGKRRTGKRQEGDVFENCTFSVMDIRAIKDAFQEVDDIVSSEYFTWVDEIDKGLIPRVKDEYKGYKRIITNSSKKGQVALLLCFTYRKSEDLYRPCVKLLINSDDCAINIPIENFLSISLFIKELNIHSLGMDTLTAFITNHNLKKTNIRSAARSVVVEDEG